MMTQTENPSLVQTVGPRGSHCNPKRLHVASGSSVAITLEPKWLRMGCWLPKRLLLLLMLLLLLLLLLVCVCV